MTGSGRGVILRAFTVSGVFWGAFAAWLPDLQRSTGVSDGELGLALGALAVAALPVMPLTGRFADRRGGVEALQVTLIASAMSLPLPGLATGLVGLVLALLVLGTTTGALDVALNAAAAEWEGAGSTGERPLMSLAHAVFSFGVVGGSLVSGWTRELGLTPLLVLLVVAALTAAVSTRVPVLRPPARAPVGAASGRPGRRRPLVVLLGSLVAASFVVEDGLQTWTPIHLERAVDAGPAVSALGVTVFAAAMGCGRLAGHVLSRRLPEDRLVLGGGVLAAVGILALLAATSAPTALAGLVLAGAGTSVVAPVLFTVVGRRAAPGRQGEDLALVNGLGYVGFIAGPVLVGAVSAVAGMPVALGLLAVIALLLGLAGPLVVLQRPDGTGGGRSPAVRRRTAASAPRSR